MPSQKSRKAIELSIKAFPAELFMWTFTWKKAKTPKEGARLWKRFASGAGGSGRSRCFNQSFPCVNGLRVFEMHPGADPYQPELSHGLHVHAILDQRLPVDIMRKLWEELAEGGRIHVMRVPREKAMYVAKYLAKSREACLKGVRLWAPIGRAEHSKVKDMVCNSFWTETYQFFAKSLPGFTELRWDQRARVVSSFANGDDLDDAFRSIGLVPSQEPDEYEAASC